MIGVIGSTSGLTTRLFQQGFQWSLAIILLFFFLFIFPRQLSALRPPVTCLPHLEGSRLIDKKDDGRVWRQKYTSHHEECVWRVDATIVSPHTPQPVTEPIAPDAAGT